MGRMTRAQRIEAEAARAFIHAARLERVVSERRQPPIEVLQRERPLGETRAPSATNFGWRHKRQHRPMWEWTLSYRQRAILKWAERYAPGQGREVASTLCVERWLYAFRREAQQRQGEADALDVALAMLRRGSRARLRKGVRVPRKVARIVPIVDLTPVSFDAVAFGREYAMSHSLEALALYGRAE